MENLNLEQPENESESFGDNSANVTDKSHDGSKLGKFNDAKSLLEAYNNLEAEFTRKCQKLAEFQKEKEESAIFNKYDSLDEFLNSTTDSDKYKKEITEILATENELNNLPNKYQVAFNIVKLAESKSAEKLANQDFIDKYILNDEKIKEQIISNYLSTLNNISSTPKIISGNPTNVYFSPNPNKPKTLREAGEIFSKMLK